MYHISFDNNAIKFLKKIKQNDRETIINKIEILKKDPYLGKRLAGDLFGLWKLRIRKFRVLYKIIENKLIIVIVNIGHRKNIYNN